MSAAVLDSHPTLTAVLFGLYEQEPGVFMPISFEDRLTAVQILADRLDPPAPAHRLTSTQAWFPLAMPVEYVDVPPFKPPSPELWELVKSFTVTDERYFDENEDVDFRTGNVKAVMRVHRTTCEHGVDTLFRCGQCILEGKQK